MGNNTISQKIDAYTKANLKALKQEEAKTGRKMTKFDIAQYMLQHGKLNKNEYANWMNTSEGFNAQAMTQAQITALRQGNIWGFAGYGGGQESYLDSMTSFEQKTPVEQFNEIFSPRVKLNETVAERKKKVAEINNHIKNKRVLNQEKTKAEQELKALVDSAKISEEDKDKDPIELTKEIEESNEEFDILEPDMKKHPVKTILTSPLRGAGYLVAMALYEMTGASRMARELEEQEAEANREKEMARIEAERNKTVNAFNKVRTQLLEKSPAYKKRLLEIRLNNKKIESLIKNFPKNKSELEKNIKEYSKYANMDDVKRMLGYNAPYNDIKECALGSLRLEIINDQPMHSDETYFDLKDVDVIKDNPKLTRMLYCDLFNNGYTAEQIQDMLPTMGHSIEEIKNIIGNGKYVIIDAF